MSRILLVTNPSDDAVTEYLDAWSEKAVDLAKGQPDTKVFELRRENVNKDKFIKLVEQENPQLILFNGHGDHNLITGFNQEVLIKCGADEQYLKNKILYALSCKAGKTLGPACIEIGSLAYIGYKEEFKLTHLNKTTKIEQQQDEMANLFLEPAYEALLALIEGNTVEKAFQRSQKMYADNLMSLMTSKIAGLNPGAASRLYHNYQNHICLGNQNVVF